jgi:hypothetical protein
VTAWLAGIDDADLAISVLTVRDVTKGVELLGSASPRSP